MHIQLDVFAIDDDRGSRIGGVVVLLALGGVVGVNVEVGTGLRRGVGVCDRSGGRQVGSTGAPVRCAQVSRGSCWRLRVVRSTTVMDMLRGFLSHRRHLGSSHRRWSRWD